MRQLQILTAMLCLSACTKEAPTSSSPAPAPQATPEKATAAWVELGQRPLASGLAEEAKKATASGLTPYAYLHAGWCGPCQAIEKTVHSDEGMVKAFAGTHVVLIDIDAADPKDLGALGLQTDAIPAFFRLDPSGKPTGDKIDGGAWGDNVPEVMAPVLGAFFHR